MHKKKLVIATLIIILLIIIVLLSYSFRKNTDQGSGSDESYRNQLLQSERSKGWKNISNEDVLKYHTGENNFDKEKVKDSFSNAVLNHDTLNYFRFMDGLFQDSRDLTDNLDQARQYLYSVLPPRQAEQMLDVYKTYLNYQIDIQPQIKEWVKTGTPEEALTNLSRLQEYRQSRFGKENAEIIFGVSDKAEEYSIRRKMIIGDNDMYGFEKERKLRMLNEIMWGNETMPFDENLTPYARYQEKLTLYMKDLSDVRPKTESEATLEQFRREIFTPEQLQRLEDVDRSLAGEKKIKEQYFAQEKEIQNANLDPETKEFRIRELQNTTFGDEAEAFRRRQTMQKALEEARQKFKLEMEQAKALDPEEVLERSKQKVTEQRKTMEQEELQEQSQK